MNWGCCLVELVSTRKRPWGVPGYDYDFDVFGFFLIILPIGVAGCSYPDLFLLWAGPGIPDRSRQLQLFPQQRLQVLPRGHAPPRPRPSLGLSSPPICGPKPSGHSLRFHPFRGVAGWGGGGRGHTSSSAHRYPPLPGH